MNIRSYLSDVSGYFISSSDVKFFCDVNGFKPSDVAYLEFDSVSSRFTFVFKKYSSIQKLVFAKSYLLDLIKCKW